MSNGFGKRDIDKLVKGIEKQARQRLPEQLSIAPDQTESQQISDVQKQFRKAGTTVSRSEAKDYVKEIRKGR